MNDSALGDIDQLGAHEVHKSARNVGGALEKRYTAVGEPVLVSAQLSERAAQDEVILSERVYEAAVDLIEAETLPPILLQDRSTPMVVYRLTSVQSPVGQLARSV